MGVYWFMDTNETDLLKLIQEATDAEDYDAVKAHMAHLIEHQSTLPQTNLTNEDLVEKGFDILLIQKERALRDSINQLNQDGDFATATQKMRELRQLQRLQPKYTGVKLR
jgi:hypothetical protein